jgi:hypothetical protein
MTASTINGPGRRAASYAQAAAQALCAWSLALHLAEWPEVSPFHVAFLVVACAVPLRTDGSDRQRATANFGAGLTLAGVVTWDLIASGLLIVVGGGPLLLTAEEMILFAATVMFTFSGAFFWIRRNPAGTA